jgi:hypothetical protein
MIPLTSSLLSGLHVSCWKSDYMVARSSRLLVSCLVTECCSFSTPFRQLFSSHIPLALLCQMAFPTWPLPLAFPASIDNKRKRDSDEQDVERDRKRHPASSISRQWSVNGSIRRTDRSLYYYLDPGRQTASVDCLNAVEKRQFVFLTGSRASGKSTRLLWLTEELKIKNYKAV